MNKSRIELEKKVLNKMVRIYCKGQKHGKELCPACKDIMNYANQRLEACMYGEDKTFCSKCKIHCYKAEMRERIKIVMRFSGPRIIFYHPLMALKHIFHR